MPKTIVAGQIWLHTPDECGYRFDIREMGERLVMVVSKGALAIPVPLGKDEGSALLALIQQVMRYDESGEGDPRRARA